MARAFSPVGLAQRSPVLRGLPPAVGTISAIAFCVALGFGIAAPAIPIYARYFEVSAFLASAVISVFALVRLITAPVAGRLIERLGERWILTSGLLIVAVSSVLAGLANDYLQLLLMRAIGGLGSSMFTVSAMALLLRTVESNQRGRAAAAFQAGFLFGGVAGPAVGGLVIGISIRAPFFVYALTLGLAAWVAWRYLPQAPRRKQTTTPEPPQVGQTADKPTEMAAQPDESGVEGHKATKGDGDPGLSLGEALRTRSYWAALLGNLTNGFVTFGLRFSLVPLFVIEGLASGPGLAGLGFLVAAATQALALIPAGRMTDNKGRKPALIIGCVFTLLGMAALVVAGAAWIFLVALAIAGVGNAFMGSAPAAIAGDMAGSSGKGMVIAVFQMTADLGAIIGPLCAGLLLDLFGFSQAFAVGVAISAVALVSAIAMRETLARD